MNRKFLGKTIDIHCGGEDLQFPHHENEIAQSEAANDAPFAHYWMHNGFLNIDNKKMSKSLGNFFTVRDAAEAYGYEPIRFFMLSAHYRTPLNYSRESLEQAQAALERLYTAKDNLTFLSQNGAEGGPNAAEQAVLDQADEFRSRFDAAMDDDFNTADAVSVLFEVVRAANKAVGEAPTKEGAAALLKLVLEFTDVLGLLYGKEEENLDDKVEALIAQRQQARKDKNWAEADRIRDELKAMGITLMDTKQGVQWKKE
jgi:cysteinyl-tRNA synthetase